MDAYVQRVHAALQQHGRSDPEKTDMGTTWTSAHLLSRHAVIVHLGDSRAYHFRDGMLCRVTRDETSDREIVAELQRHSTPQPVCDSLVERALANGGKDNLTVLLAAMNSKTSPPG